MATHVAMSRSEFNVFYSITTRWRDNDLNGHISNVTYYSYFDTAVTSFLINHCGLDIQFGEVVGLVVSSGCEYLEPIAYPDKIEVGLRIDRLGNSSVQFSLGVFKDKEQQASAFGHIIHVYVDRQSKKPVSIPGYMRKNMEKIEVKNSVKQ